MAQAIPRTVMDFSAAGRGFTCAANGSHDAGTAPVTMSLTVRQQSAGRLTITRYIVTRASTRIHIAFPDKREWLFERNEAEPGRVSGFLVHHDRRTIVVYEEDDLRTWFDIRQWSDVDTFVRGAGTFVSPIPIPTDAGTRVILDSAWVHMNPELLRPPYERFTDYGIVDLATWLEG